MAVVSRLQWRLDVTKEQTSSMPSARSDAEKRALLSNLLRARAERKSPAGIVPDAAGRYEPFPLTDIQQAYWIGRSANLELGGVSCQAYYEFELPTLDVARVNLAWQRLIERHDMLRAVFLPDGTQQILREVEPFQIEVIDLRSWEPRAAAAHLEAVRERMAREVKPVDRWPLFEVVVHQLADTYRLHLSFDLLIVDFVSLQRLFGELFQLYLDPALQLPALQLSFRDCVLAMEKMRSSEAYLRAQRYWRSRLGSLPPAPELPLRATAVARPRFVRRSAVLSKATWQRLAERGSARGLTAAGVLLTAFGEVLATWSRHRRFTVNLTTSYRPPLHPQIQHVVGDFTSIVLVELDCATPGCFTERGRRLQQRLWDDLEHQQYSGVQVLRDLARNGDSAGNALMPVVFTSSLTQAAGGGGQSVNQVPSGHVYSMSQTPQVWLDHTVFEVAGELHYNWDAVEELFHDGVLSDMFKTYADLLERLSEDDQLWEGETSSLLPADQLRMLTGVNATNVPRLEHTLLHEPFEEQARFHPDRIAIVSPERQITYGELSARAGELGDRLRSMGVAPNTLVAVVMHKGWEQVVAVLGILRAGAAYLPIEADLPAQRMLHLLDHGQVSVVVTQPWLTDKVVYPEGIRTLMVDAEPPSAPASLSASCQTASDLAYVIYTSGSTGLPKGVMIDHGSALNTIVDVNRRFGIAAGDCCLGVSSLSFDLSVYDIFGMLGIGGTLVLPSAHLLRDPDHWLELLRTHRVTVWNSAPALMQMLVDYVEGSGCEPPADLRRVLLSGDWIPVTLPGRLAAIVPTVETTSLGGATEASIWSIYHPILSVDPTWPSIPYGRPLANQRFYVLSGELELCPVWVTGELFIAGDGLAKGYWRDSEQTRARFITHPRTGERLYRTGDLGRYLPSGDIEFLGREDSQVKILGHRVELGEIESVLARHDTVAEAAVVAVGNARQGRRLAAFVVLQQGQSLDAGKLRGFLREHLPEYMVPSAISLLDAMPLSSNGKIDRKRLESLGTQTESRSDGPSVPPRTSVELELASVWAEVLELEDVGVHDDFFALGGDSVRGIKLVTRARALGLEISLRELFGSRTIAGLASEIDGRSRGESSAPLDFASDGDCLVPIQVRAERATLFCVHPSGGQIECYFELSRWLDDVSMYGFRSTHPLHEKLSIRQLVARYVEALVETQPTGNIHLLGFSLGGVIAFEMAHQLTMKGRTVALLALLDLGVPDLTQISEDPVAGAARTSERLARELEGLDHYSHEDRTQMLLKVAIDAGIAPDAVSIDALTPFLERSRQHVQAMHAHTPEVYDAHGGRVLILRGQRFADADDLALGWRAFVRGPLEVQYIAADHFDLLRAPAVGQVAAAISARIEAGDTDPAVCHASAHVFTPLLGGRD